jgi:salicylate biosynthesis isochorismate synthase/menaquinone-specific isochorismate synthase
VTPPALERTLAQAVRAAGATGTDQWVVWRRRAPSDAGALAMLAGAAGDAFYYAIPEADLAIGTRGAVCAVEADGAQRFETVERALDETASRLFGVGEDDPRGVPLWVGGFAFSDTTTRDETWRGFPAARWWIPRELVFERAGETWRSSARRIAPGDDPATLLHDLARPVPVASRRIEDPTVSPHRVTLDAAGDAPQHARLVARALDAIARGDLEKVVVARALDVERTAPFDPIGLLAELRRLHPRCATYAVARDGAWLVGATPERLLRREGHRLLATALAGSAPRGRSPEEDARLRRTLVESKKEQSEHAVAVRALREALAPVCSALRVPEAPTVLGLGGVQHLCTPIEASLEEEYAGLLSIAGQVHPTAAVAGAPRGDSLAWLAHHEGLHRGWYAGLVGWVDASGDGELSAALRCALLRGGRARLFAGGGIVAGADPEAELRETRLKWNALLPSLLEL